MAASLAALLAEHTRSQASMSSSLSSNPSLESIPASLDGVLLLVLPVGEEGVERVGRERLTRSRLRREHGFARAPDWVSHARFAPIVSARYTALLGHHQSP